MPPETELRALAAYHAILRTLLRTLALAAGEDWLKVFDHLSGQSVSAVAATDNYGLSDDEADRLRTRAVACVEEIFDLERRSFELMAVAGVIPAAAKRTRRARRSRS